MSDQVQENIEGQQLDTNKTRLIKLGIMALVVLVTLGLLFLFVFLSRTSWKNGTAEQIQKVLLDNGFECSVEEMDTNHGTIASNVVSFSLSGSEKMEKKHGVLVRMTSIFGPLAGVFMYDDGNDRATFVDFVSLDGFAKETINSVVRSSQISYWEKKLPSTMKNVRNLSGSVKESQSE